MVGAKSYFNDALQRADGDVPARVGLARVLIAQRLWEPALNEIDKAVDTDPSSISARYYKAIIV